jgi:hypothetical protein
MLHGLLARILQPIDFSGNSTWTELLRTTTENGHRREIDAAGGANR